MSIHLQVRVTALEVTVKELRETIDGLIEAMAAPPLGVPEPRVNPNGPRTLCPKCGLKPNYYLHTKQCRGQLLEKN